MPSEDVSFSNLLCEFIGFTDAEKPDFAEVGKPKYSLGRKHPGSSNIARRLRLSYCQHRFRGADLQIRAVLLVWWLDGAPPFTPVPRAPTAPVLQLRVSGNLSSF